MSITQYPPLTESEYLRLEAQSPVRNEYLAGEIFAMTGGTLRHNAIAINIAAALKNHLRGSGCTAFMADVRVRIPRHHAFYYPDVLVACSPFRSGDDWQATTIDDPKLIIEVLSASTAAIDTREKLLAYRTLPSLFEYALVSQDQARVVIHRRLGDLGWERIEFSGKEAVDFTSTGLRIAMNEVYEGITFDSPP